jgi:hypothetical protein
MNAFRADDPGFNKSVLNKRKEMHDSWDYRVVNTITFDNARREFQQSIAIQPGSLIV